MTKKYFVHSDWSILELSGNDRDPFLHNILSQNIKDQQPNERSWATLLTSKGKLIGLLDVWKMNAKFFLATPNSHREGISKALETYWITEDLALKWLDDFQVVSIFDSSSSVHSPTEDFNKIKTEPFAHAFVKDYVVKCRRLIIPKNSLSAAVADCVTMSDQEYERIRIRSQFANAGVDYEDPIPLEVPFLTKAISFTKGCYVGQETINRLHARGMNVSRRLLYFSCPISANVSVGSVLLSQGEEVGAVTSVCDDLEAERKIGLAWVHRKAFHQVVRVDQSELEFQWEVL